MGQYRGKNPSDLLIRVNIQLSREDIEYLDKNFTSRSAGMRQILRERSIKGPPITKEKLQKVFQVFQSSITETLDYIIQGEQNIEALAVSFCAWYYKMHDTRPDIEDVKPFLIELLDTHNLQNT